MAAPGTGTGWETGGSALPAPTIAPPNVGVSSNVGTGTGWETGISPAPVGAPAKSSSGGGLLGSLEHDVFHNPVTHALGIGAHYLGKTATGLAGDAYGLPGSILNPQHGLLADAAKSAREEVSSAGTQPFTKTFVNPVISGMAKTTVQSLSDPSFMAQHPDQTFLSILGLASLGAGSVARVSEAADAARTGGLGDVAKALVTKPEVQPRLIDVNGGRVPLQPSHAAAPRLIQNLHDAVMQRAMNENPGGRVGAYGATRVRGSLEETGRYQKGMQEAPAIRLRAEAAKLPGRSVAGKLSPEREAQQAAMRLTSIQQTPEEAIAYHAGRAATTTDPAELAAHTHLVSVYSKVRDQNLVHLDEARPAGQKVFVNPENQQLALADEKLAAGQAARDKILIDSKQMTPEGLQARIDAPGRIMSGGRYVNPTPGRLGQSPALDAAIAARDQLSLLHDSALEKEATWSIATGAGSATKDLRGPMNTEQAAARLAALDAQHAAFVQKIIPETSRYGGDISKQEQLNRNFNAGKTGIKPETVGAEERSIADAKLRDVIAANKGNPVADRVGEMLAERDALRAQMTARGEASLEGTPPVPFPRGGAQPVVPAASNPFRDEVVQYGNALDLAQQRVDKLAVAAENRITPTGIVGGETARPGRGYVPEYSTEKSSVGGSSRMTGGMLGKVRGLIAKSAPYKAENLQAGNLPADTTGLVARQMTRAYNYLSNDQLRRKVAGLGSATRQTGRDVLVNTQELKSAKVPASAKVLTGDLRSTVDADSVAGHAAAFDTWREQMLPHLNPSDKTLGRSAQDRMGIGTPAPKGFMWVDRKMIPRTLTEPLAAPPNRFVSLVDSINSAVTSATVYLKPGHIGTRAFTDESTNIMQGSANPVSVGKSVLLYHELTPKDRDLAIAAAGRGGIASMPSEGENLVGSIARAGSSAYSRLIDSRFRFNSVAYEARKAGYDTPEKFSQMLHDAQNPGALDPVEAAKIDGVLKRANREAIAYDRMSPLEQKVLARVFWFYPWLKGSTVFAGNTLLEHPLKAAFLGSLGNQGANQAYDDLGPQPTYAQGNFKVGGSSSMPLVANFDTFSPVSSPAQLIDALVNTLKGHPTSAQTLLNFVNPALAAGVGAATGLNAYGETPTTEYPATNIWGEALRSLVSSLPETAFLHSQQQTPAEKAKSMYPASEGYSILRLLGGSAVPRPENRAIATLRALAEKKAAG